MSQNLQVGYHLPRNYFMSVAPVIDETESAATSPPKSNIKPAETTPRNSLTPIEINSDAKSSPRNIVKNYNMKSQPPKRFCNLPRIWICICSLFCLMISIAALVTIVVLYTKLPSKVANFGESCTTKPCNQTKYLSCIDGICQCNDFEQFVFDPINVACAEKTILERSHGENCKTGSTNCLNGSKCIDSICQCNISTQYWNGSTCLNKKTFNQVCMIRNTTTSSPYYLSINCVSNDECTECVTNSLLKCDSTTHRCVCPSSSYYYDTSYSMCLARKLYNSYCTSNSECDSSIGLYCPTTLTSVANCPTVTVINRCDCRSGYYYDSSLGKCNAIKAYYRPCSVDCECDSSKGLQCLSNLCVCNQYTWFNGISCASKRGYGSSCSDHIECRGDLGLICSNSSTCLCARPANHYWDYRNSNCVQCPAGWVMLLIGSTYKCYLFASNAVGVTTASSVCEAYNGFLVAISSSAEYDAIMQQIDLESATRWFWIGNYADCTTWRWYFFKDNTAAPMGYYTWYRDASTIAPVYDCNHIYLLLHFNNNTILNWVAGSLQYYICEI